MAKLKFDIKEFVNNVKSMVSPVTIPDASQDNPVGYLLSEISKSLKEVAELNVKQADIIAKITNMLGAMHQSIASCVGKKTTNEPAPIVKQSSSENQNSQENKNNTEQGK
jgi:hypothetical protein